jgi:hypothetical protein
MDPEGDQTAITVASLKIEIYLYFKIFPRHS